MHLGLGGIGGGGDADAGAGAGRGRRPANGRRRRLTVWRTVDLWREGQTEYYYANASCEHKTGGYRRVWQLRIGCTRLTSVYVLSSGMEA